MTVQTIAREANVSVGTVDRALNNRGRINEETRRRILEIADQLGYHPNKIASALGRQRKLRIAAITPCNPYFFYRHIRDGMEDAVRETLDGRAAADLRASSEYWAQFEGPVDTVSTAVYDGFLKSYGTIGVKSYGACVDLLTAYFK